VLRDHEVRKATGKLGAYHPRQDPLSFEVPGNLGTTIVTDW
jgi:hypothetical protein